MGSFASLVSSSILPPLSWFRTRLVEVFARFSDYLSRCMEMLNVEEIRDMFVSRTHYGDFINSEIKKDLEKPVSQQKYLLEESTLLGSIETSLRLPDSPLALKTPERMRPPVLQEKLQKHLVAFTCGLHSHGLRGVIKDGDKEKVGDDEELAGAVILDIPHDVVDGIVDVQAGQECSFVLSEGKVYSFGRQDMVFRLCENEVDASNVAR